MTLVLNAIRQKRHGGMLESSPPSPLVSCSLPSTQDLMTTFTRLSECDVKCKDPDDHSAAGAKCGHISRWDVSSVTGMNILFQFKESFNADISRWNTSSVANVFAMFYVL